MLIVFDLDHTLFNTDFLKRDFCDVFSRCGVPEDTFWQTFHQSYDMNPSEPGTYAIEKHLTIVPSLTSKKKTEIHEALVNTVMSRGVQYLYPEVLAVLAELKQNHDLYLVTKGNDSFQKLKISATNIGHLFKEIFIVSQTKEQVLKKITAGKGRVINVNDRHDELSSVRNAFANVYSVLIRRQRNDQQTDLPVINNLREVAVYMKK